MKKQIIILTLVSATALMTLQSNRTGSHSNVGNRTGSNGATTGCASCHGNNSAATSVQIEILSNGSPVTSYTPGLTYDVTLKGSNSNARPKFGFQLTAGTASTSSTTLGTFDNTGVTGTTLRASNRLVEQNTALEGTINAGTATYEKTFKWTAPAAGSGDVKFYAVLNAVNDNGNDDSGDNWNLGTSGVITESGPSSIHNTKKTRALHVYPNPANNGILYVNTTDFKSGNIDISIVDVTGKVVLQKSFKNNTNEKLSINIEQLAKGNHIILLNDGTSKYSQSFVKQ